MPLLEIFDLSVKYQNSPKWALKDVTFQSGIGELIVIAGSSGCGKSTLAQTIVRLIPSFVKAAVQGTIRLNGNILDKIKQKDLVQNIGYVPQYPSDFTTTLLVEEEIAFPLENLGFPRSEIKNQVKYVLEQLEISHLRFRLVTELSSGELQRVALATALAPIPPILILDEPMARIDPKSEVKLAKILRKLVDSNHLILAFEHRLDYLLPETDRLILLENGKIIGDGNPRHLLEDLTAIDLPEVSEITWSDEKHRTLSLQEANMSLINELTLD
ncbi:MAG: energy-coupling factor ABC transporter ATP-binding protein [Candidatus Hodarchaeales archaeon]